MQVFLYGPEEIDHLKRRDKKLGRAIDRIGMIERQVMPDYLRPNNLYTDEGPGPKRLAR
jgi:hypothetical protein